MKVFYPNGKVINKNPKVAYETLESGIIIMWTNKTVRSFIENI